MRASPDEWSPQVFDVMRRADQHVFQVLTKRHERHATLPWPDNVWVGASRW